MRIDLTLALDGISKERVLELVRELWQMFPLRAKIHDLYDAYGPSIIRDLKEAGAEHTWVDYKIHDTKDTAALRVRALVRNGATIITVHAGGGVEMMEAAVKAASSEAKCWSLPPAEIYAITVLTSLDDNEIARVYGNDRTREQIVHELALMAYEAGVRTVVCSAQEVGMLKRSSYLNGMDFVVAGTRSKGAALGQQKRTGTPEQAILDGASELVVGSQVTKAENPAQELKKINTEIGKFL